MSSQSKPTKKTFATMLLSETDPHAATLTVEELSLVVIEGPALGRSLALDKECLLIGRESWCDLPLDDNHASSQHCECWLTEEGLRVRDLGSRNGVLIGECRVLDAYIGPGDTIKLGKSVLELRRVNPKPRQVDIAYHDKSGLLVGKSQAMRQLFSYLERLGQRDLNLLFTGETGTGKSQAAEALHRQSLRSSGPFVQINCGAIPEALFESELFGHEKGSFTGAATSHTGVFEQAQGGTLFLDEIGELPLELQAKLLSAVQRKKIRRVGGAQEISVDVRLIAATNRSFAEEIEAGRFREDLYHRLAVAELELPPLRTRPEDIPLIAHHLLDALVPGEAIQLDESALRSLRSFDWPGNIRQLANVLERSCALLDGNLLTADALLFQPIGKQQSKRVIAPDSSAGEGAVAGPSLAHFDQLGGTFDDYLEQVKYNLLKQAYDESEGIVSKAAKRLQKSRSWTYDQMKRLGIRGGSD